MKMKKFFQLLTLTLALLLLVSCSQKTTYTVLFDSDGGSAVDSYFALEGDLVTEPPQPVKDGYQFLGWYSGSTIWDFEKYRISGNTYLKAKWNPIIYTVTYIYESEEFPPEGITGTGYLPSDENPHNFTADSETFVLQAPVITAAGYVFTGWYADAGFQHPVTEIKAGTVGDVVLYARIVKSVHE